MTGWVRSDSFSRETEPCGGWTGDTEGEVLLVRRLLEKSEDEEEPLFRLAGPERIGNLLVEAVGVGVGISSVGRVIDRLVGRDGDASGGVGW